METHMDSVRSPAFEVHSVVNGTEGFIIKLEASDELQDNLADSRTNFHNTEDSTAKVERETDENRLSWSRGISANTSRRVENFLETGMGKNEVEARQVREMWPEVKIEIDVADTVFLGDLNTQENSETRKTSQTSPHCPVQKGPSKRFHRDPELAAAVNLGSDSRHAIAGCLDVSERRHQLQEVEASQSQCVTRYDIAVHQAGLPGAPLWHVKVDPDADDSSAVMVQEETGTDRRPFNSDVCAVMTTQSSFFTEDTTVHGDKDLDSSVKDNLAETVTPAQIADPVSESSQDIHIKPEPMTPEPDEVRDSDRDTSNIVDTSHSTGHSEMNECRAEMAPNYNDFVVKMEPESDEETVVDPLSDCSQEEESPPASAEEDDSSLTKQPPRKKSKGKTSLIPAVKPRPHQCQYCDASFVKKSRLIEHSRSHTDERPYKCEQCGVSFRKRESLNVHIRTHTGELPFQCKECNCAFKCSQELKRHSVRKHTNIRPFSCADCEARFFSQTDLRAHRRVHTGEKPYQCSDCHAAFRKSSALTSHMRIHTGQKPYACSECERTFRRSDQLKRHMKLHTGEKPFVCKDCDAAFTCSSDLKKHGARKHSTVKPFSCPECGNRFFTNEDLKMHRIFHMGIKPHTCTVCGSAFVRASDLKVHMRIHTGERPFLCKLCSATFARSGDLRLHLRMHEDKRPFTCTVCNLSFRRSGHLTRHMNTHTGRKSFSCEDCEAAFFTSSDLKRHTTRVHKKDVAHFSCLECSAKFFTHRDLSSHMIKHTSEKPFPCKICEAGFSQADLLSSHMDLHSLSEKQECKVEPASESGEQYMYVDVSMIASQNKLLDVSMVKSEDKPMSNHCNEHPTPSQEK